MSFLTDIDNIYKDTCKQFNVKNENKNFRCFIPVEPVKKNTTCTFLIKKQEKSKLMLVNGKQHIYISDLHIINTILEMKEDDIEWFLKQFIKIYQNKFIDFKFKINNEVYNGCGIQYYPSKKSLILFSDTHIEYNDFIFVVNFIFSKDKCWEDTKEIDGFSKNTICKYIVLIDYYANKNVTSKKFLKEIGYPIKSKKPVDNKDTKKLFKNTEKFDISLYL